MGHAGSKEKELNKKGEELVTVYFQKLLSGILNMKHMVQ